MTAHGDGAENTERSRVRRMRAQLLTVLGCAAGATVSYFIACAVIW